MSFILLAGIVLSVLYVRWWRKRASELPLPPGPPPHPVVGNLFDMSLQEMWLPATRWAKQFGDVVYVHIFGQGLVYLNTYDAAVDLLDRRGSIYSDKPRLVMVQELCGLSNMVPFVRYGDVTRRQRRLMNGALNTRAVTNYEPLFETEVQGLLQRLITDPEDFGACIRQYTGGSTLLVVYGYQVRSSNDKLLDLANECMTLLSTKMANNVGIWPVDVIPALKYIPSWFPGAGFKRNAAEWRALMQEFVDIPFEFVKKSLREGTAGPSYCSILLEDMPKIAEEGFLEQMETDIRWTANSMYLASIDSMLTVLLHFLLAMMHYPDVLRKAQAELDTVVGRNRLPTFTDRPSLPYIDCIFSEVLRWGVPVPMSLLHRVMEDDVYNGMRIPKGSLVFPNVWKMLRDEELFPEPERFYPERYLAQVDEATARRMDPRSAVFGFGRRRCPGFHLVESSVWIVIASMSATLDISKAKDEHGKVIEPDVVFTNPVFRTPSAFKCNIRPRSEDALRVIQQCTERSG